MTTIDISGFQYPGQAPKEVTVIRSMAPINLIVYYPKTAEGHGYELVEGDTICIEPMSCLGKPANYVDKDSNWTVRMKDGSTGCHCEHTILVTHDGYEVLTMPD